MADSVELRRPENVLRVALATAALAALAAGCQTKASPAAPRPTSPSPAAAAAAAGGCQVQAAELSNVCVAPEDLSVPYDRDADWGKWQSQGRGCDTRKVVLQQQGRGVRTVGDCKIVAGAWTSVYDGAVLTSARQVQIDHLVPVKEANRSGARGWTREQREAFYNDPSNLVAVSVRSNEQKSDGDPARWRPVVAEWCDYARRYVAVKAKYGLSVDPQERAALDQMDATCR
jgi:hypothetical protein